MSDKSFLDSNIFIYTYDQREPVKQSIADNLIRGLAISGDAVISYQVIHEFFNWALVNGPAKMPQAGCGTLYSEDLQHGQQFGTVRVQNPFL